MENCYRLDIVRKGFTQTVENGDLESVCTITLLRGPQNILIDTGCAWDAQFLIASLAKYGLEPGDIHYVVGTHLHSDHVGNLNLFTNATHIVGFDIHKGSRYLLHDFKEDIPFEIDEFVQVIPTPGHTCSDVTVLVENVEGLGAVAIVGDLFECEDDLNNEQLWREFSHNSELQDKQRKRILKLANCIVPGHGAMFRVNPEYAREPSIEEVM